MIPPTRYAQSHDADIAYKVVGEGPRDMVFTMPFASHLDMLWEPGVVDVIQRLSSWSRLIVYDKRGTGLSDRDLTGITAEQLSDDVVAVMDAEGLTKAVLVGFLDSAAIFLLTAARYPERVSAVVACSVLAVGHSDEDHPFGVDETTRHLVREAFRSGGWGQGLAASIMAPETAVTPQQLAWSAKHETMAATPRAAAKLFDLTADLDLRPHLGQIQAPVLLVHDGAFPLVPAEAVQWLAARLPTAKLKMIDTSSARGSGRPVIDYAEEIEEFLLGTRTGTVADRQVATLLVTDVVGSTEIAARTGDASWKDLLAGHRAAVRASLARFGGVEIDTAGDGFLASFALPSSALRCAREIAADAAAAGIEIRVGLHTGEVLLQQRDIIGIAVHIAARVAALANPGHVMFTDTVRSLVIGSGISYEPAGEHALKGIPGEWMLYRLVTG